MMPPTYGDLASSFQLRRQTSSLRTQMTTLSQELTTQKTSNIRKHLGGNFNTLAGLERSLQLQGAYRRSNQEAAGLADTQQLALTQVQAAVEEAGPRFLFVATAAGPTQRDAVYSSAADQFSSLVSQMNTRWGGRAIFAGAATQGASLADPDAMLAELRLAVAGETTAGGLMAAADAWFDSAAGFGTLGYLGSDDTLAPARIAEGDQVSLSITAHDPAIRETLKAFAVATLAGEGMLAGNETERRNLLQDLGNRLVDTTDDLIGLRATVGTAQERIENADVRMDAEKSALTLAMNALTGADPYETAVKLEAVQTQLETVYTLTARMSRLSLAAALG